MRDTQYHRRCATCTDAFKAWLTLESQLFIPKQLFYFTGQRLHAKELLIFFLDQQMLEYMEYMECVQSGAKYAKSCSFSLPNTQQSGVPQHTLVTQWCRQHAFKLKWLGMPSSVLLLLRGLNSNRHCKGRLSTIPHVLS